MRTGTAPPRRADEALRESEGLLRAVVETAVDGIITIDERGTIRTFNPAAERIFGYAADAVIGQNVALLMPEPYRAEHDRYLANYQRTGERQIIGIGREVRGRRKDGTDFPLDLAVSETRVGERRIFTGIVRDITTRKQAEESLRESEEHTRRIIDSAMDAVVAIDADGIVIGWNRQAESTFGWPSDEALGRRLHEMIMPPRYHAAHVKGLRRFLATGDGPILNRRIEIEALRRDGSEFPIELSVVPIHHGNAWHFSAFIRDITARTAAEEAAARLAAIVQFSEDAIVGKSLDGIITSWNRGAEHIFGYSAEEAVGRSILMLIPPERQAEEPFILECIRRDEPVAHYDTVRIRKDGQAIDVSVTVSPIRNASGKVVGASKVARDITGRKRAEQALRESEQRFRMMADGAPVLIWMSGTDGLCNWFNQPWLDFRGRTLEQELGNGWAEGVHADELQGCLDTYLSSFHARRGFRMEYRRRRGDGEYRWVLDTGIPLFTPAGEFTGYIGSCIDISERKITEEQIQQLNENLERLVRARTAQLEEANRELESFAYSVSHDLRAPLRHISGFAELLQKRTRTALDEDSARYVRTIAASAARAGKLVDDLLAFSRMGRTDLRRATVNVRQLIDDVRAEFAHEMEGRNVVWNIAPLPEVRADPVMLRLVIQNLISNALKYTRPRAPARIDIGVQPPPPSETSGNGEIVFFVRDNGVGFDMRYVDKLFGVFQRLHSEQEFEGIGIGLANVRRIIQRHGGRAWAEGAVDAGATIYFSLPRP